MAACCDNAPNWSFSREPQFQQDPISPVSIPASVLLCLRGQRIEVVWCLNKRTREIGAFTPRTNFNTVFAFTACDPVPAPAPVRDRSQYVASTVIVLCIVALALGYIFTTTDDARPTSTAITTAGSPAPVETTSSTTTNAPDKQDLMIVNTLKTSLGETLLIGTQFQENQALHFLMLWERATHGISPDRMH
ncbi:uncharacterized protein LOC125941062 [Dermacentor silvarum]|uniref:uncharacterized protein LOC125941062 n=1 Tax=Dermacentor silvarum TaxID=543639 RepID=UPI0021013D50|nr:uncharacterized protein LOC125941062 [Dermacentor silvarum]